MSSSQSSTRRDFLKIAATAGIGLAIGIQVTSCSESNNNHREKIPSKVFIPNIWLEILENDKIICFFAEAEMGQGVASSLPLILAEELGADWDQIEVHHAPITALYGKQYTGGSKSIRENWEPLRKAGAMAHAMLITAASKILNTSSDNLLAANSFVINQKNGKKISFGKLVQEASKLPLPESAQPRSPDNYKLIGLSPLPKFSLDKVTGKLVYASDLHLPNMVYATVVHPPVFESSYKSHDDNKAKKLPGYIDAFPIKEGLAIIAKDTWTAFEAARAINIDWSDSRWQNLTSNDIYTQMEEADKQPGEILKDRRPNSQNTDSQNTKILERIYTTPFQAHATMEPMCCVAYIHDDTCEVWAPTQSARYARDVAEKFHYNFIRRFAAIAKRTISPSSDTNPKVIIHPQFLGGGFGRRLKNDYVHECLQIASRIDKPVKLQWTREEDIRHDFYRTTSRHIMRATIDRKTKRITHWEHKIIAPSISTAHIPYNIPSQAIKAVKIKTPIPLGDWRSVNNSTNIYAIESFIDEVASELSLDPIELRLSLLDDEPRLKQTLVEANRHAIANKHADSALGCAIFKGYGSFIALLTEMKGGQNKPNQIMRMTACVDCGLVIDPDQARAQIEGGLIFALTAAIKSRIEINDGAVKQGNFNDFQLLTLKETPKMDIILIPSQKSPGGLGEVPVPPVAPSIQNALLAFQQ